MAATENYPGPDEVTLGTNSNASYIIKKDVEATAQALTKYSVHDIWYHVLVCIGWILYLSARVRTCLHANGSLWPTQTDSWFFLICEIIFAGPEILQVIEISLSFAPGSRPASRSVYRLEGNCAPKVHVFITTCGEDLDIIRDTVKAAAFQDYPRQCYQVFVLDDAKQPGLEMKIHQFNKVECQRAGAQPVVYLCRPKKADVPHHYKAGNLSYGIVTSHDQYGSSEFIAGLDADMIAEPDWLQRTVPHLVMSPELALVNIPQHCYDMSTADPLAQDANVVQQILEPARDRVACSMCHGSGYVLRREALDGGWPLVNIAEDQVCSYLLNQTGWKTAFIEDKLQFGIKCGSFHTLVAQRMRWVSLTATVDAPAVCANGNKTAGNLLSAHKWRFFLLFLHRSRITKVQRVHGLLQSLKPYTWAALGVPLILLPIGLLLLNIWSPDSTPSLDRNVVRCTYAFLWLITRLWQRMVLGSRVGTTNALNLANNRVWMTPYIVRSVFGAFWVDLANSKFEVSGTFRSPINERSRKNRAGLWQRMSDPLIMMHTTYWLVVSGLLLVHLGSIARATAFGNRPEAYPESGIMVRVLEVALSALVPVLYMVFPPTDTDRRDHLTRDASGSYRASHKTWIKRDGNLLFWKEAAELMVVILCDWL